jgi:hypothetical protein
MSDIEAGRAVFHNLRLVVAMPANEVNSIKLALALSDVAEIVTAQMARCADALERIAHMQEGSNPQVAPKDPAQW